MVCFDSGGVWRCGLMLMSWKSWVGLLPSTDAAYGKVTLFDKCLLMGWIILCWNFEMFDFFFTRKD